MKCLFVTRAAASGARFRYECSIRNARRCEWRALWIKTVVRQARSTPHKKGDRKGQSKTQSGKSQYTAWVVPTNLAPLKNGVYRCRIIVETSETRKTITVTVRSLECRV